jgi:hypothetical protein
MPSLSNSPWIRGAPHSGLAKLISRISSRISGGTVGRPPRRLDFQRQKDGHCKIGLDDRCRELDGEIRQKRGDALVGTLRKTYGRDFSPGARSDMRLDTLRERTGASLSKIIKGK